MSQILEADVLAALAVVEDPDLRRDIVTLGFVQDVRICGGTVAFKVELTTPACPMKELLKEQAEAAVRSLPGVEVVNVEMTAQVRASALQGELAPGVRHVIAVASGKGGVGKSTVSCNLAVALAQTGASVGLLDADIYGPTVPIMMGITESPETDGQMIQPIEKHGVKVMSIGFFLDEDKAVLWRGPMIGKALSQFLGDVAWGDLDYLVVDLPPGTGDAPMSLAQLMPLTGVVVVMTPQDVARRIANKSILMFRALEESTERPLPILGVVENMSGFACPHCGEITAMFGSGGGEQAAEELGVPFLGAVPMDPVVCDGGDQGLPSILLEPGSAHAAAFRSIAGKVAARVSSLTMAEQAGPTGGE